MARISALAKWILKKLKLNNRVNDLDPVRYRLELGRLGLEHYASGRRAAKDGLTTSGNELHHAIEFLLKAVLVNDGVAIEDLRAYGHDLKRAWRAVKAKDATLAVFDRTISTLDRFEELRYPDRLLRSGMTFEIGWCLSTQQPPTEKGTKTLRHYRIAIEEIDKLILVLFKRGSLGPKAFLTNTGVRAAILDSNHCAAGWEA